MLMRAGMGTLRSIGRLLRRTGHELAVLTKIIGAGALLTALIVVLDALFVPSGQGRDAGSRLPRP